MRLQGRAYYNEVHIGDLIVNEKYRGQNVGSQLVRTVEDAESLFNNWASDNEVTKYDVNNPNSVRVMQKTGVKYDMINGVTINVRIGI